MYKNLLQELVQKEGSPMPKYITMRYGEGHVPTFSATVEIQGKLYQGDAAKTKRQAEMNAAKIAYSCLYQSKLWFPPLNYVIFYGFSVGVVWVVVIPTHTILKLLFSSLSY